MAKKLHHTLGDYVTMGISPVLIITLVTSLVFFLAEILYGGRPYEGRVLWFLFWSVFGIVWVARIAMHPAIGTRARLYGLVLGVVVWIALQKFISVGQVTGLENPVFRPFDWAVSLGFFALIWWCANRLTWDCTFIDDAVDASGKGVFEAAGLEGDNLPTAASESPGKDEDAGEGFSGWLERYRRYREEQRKQPHTPGVWVVYFSLAALPLFGLGQALIPVEAVDRRRYAFWLLGIHTASGLGLLLTTCYLGLRRYLRQRKLKMPVAMTGMWLTLGSGLIGAMLLAAAILPRPQMEYSPFRPRGQTAGNQQASQHAMLSGEPGKGDGKPGAATPSNDPKAAANPHVKTEKKGNGKGEARGNGKGRQEPGGKGSENNQGKPGSDQPTSRPDRDDPERRDSEKQSSAPRTPDNQEGSVLSESAAPSSSPNLLERTASSLGKLAEVLKWVVFVVLAVAALLVLFRSGLGFLANFTDWARKLLDSWRAWWNGLFGRDASEGSVMMTESEVEVLRRPFAAFANPFQDGSAACQTPAEVIRYTFAALDAWAEERGWGRLPEETPREFARRLGEEAPALEEEVHRFADHYAQAVYARDSLTPACLPAIRALWQRLDSNEKQVVSIG
jgi:hypothetical protein